MKRIMLLMLVLCCAAAAQQPCGLPTIRGTYAASYLGWLTVAIPGQTPQTFSGTVLGVFSIAWDGKLSGVGAVSGFGPVADYEVSGTVEVKPDCTGTMRWGMRPKGSNAALEVEVDRIVVLPEEKTILAIPVSMGPGSYPAMLGTWKRMSQDPGAASW